MNFNQVMAIYRSAVDQSATAAEGCDWWSEVQTEVAAVIAAPTKSAAAAIIAWWKSEYEWTLDSTGRRNKVARPKIQKFPRQAGTDPFQTFVVELASMFQNTL